VSTKPILPAGWRGVGRKNEVREARKEREVKPMTTKLDRELGPGDPEFDAFVQKLLSTVPKATPPPTPPPPAPHLVVASSAALSLETERERFDRAKQRLMDEEKRKLEKWAEREQSERQQLVWQQRIDAWVEDQRAIAAHERWMQQQLEPTGGGIYSVAPCHRGRGED